MKIGVYVCYCGSNIAATVDVEEVAEYARQLDGVVVARTNKYTCSDPGQEAIRQDIIEWSGLAHRACMSAPFAPRCRRRG